MYFTRETIQEDHKLHSCDFDCDAIQHTVHEFYAKKEYLTLEKLLQILKEIGLATGGCISSWNLLRKIGFICEIGVTCMSYQR